MSTGEPTPPDFDFDAVINGSDIVDKGVFEFLQTVKATERALQSQGGKRSPNYDQALTDLNHDWPQQAVRAEVSGQLYVFGDIVDEDVIERANGLWGEYTRTDEGLYWEVQAATLVSRGIVDRGDETVDLVCAFSFEDDEVPAFTCMNTVQYERRTKEASEQYLRREWPRIVEFTEAIVPEFCEDAAMIPDMLRAIVAEFSDELYDDADLCFALSEFVTYRIAFNQTAAYALVLNGLIDFHDHEGGIHVLDVTEDKLLYVYRPAVVFSNKGDATGAAFVSSAGDGSDDDEIVITPLDAVRQFSATYSRTSLFDVSSIAMTEHASGEARVERIDDVLSLREHNLEALRSLQTTINAAFEQARHVSALSCETEEDAKEQAESIAETIKQHLDGSDIHQYALTFEGEGVGVAASRFGLKGAISEGLMVTSQDQPGFMESWERRTGHYETMYGTFSLHDDDDEQRIAPAVCMQLQIGSHADTVSWINDIPANEMVIRSFAAVPLDQSSTIVVERLDIEETIEASLQQLAESGSGDVIEQFEALYEAAMTYTGNPISEAALKALHDMSAFCYTQNDDVQRKALIQALAGLFNDMTVALNTTDDKNELTMGSIVDVKFESSADFPPVGLIFTLAAYDDSIHRVGADAIQTLISGGHA